MFNLVNDKYLERDNERREADLPTARRDFIHMKEVHVGGASEFYALPLWRGALADVTGWSLGSWNPRVSPRQTRGSHEGGVLTVQAGASGLDSVTP